MARFGKQKNGLTLLELLIVIIIVGVLTSLALPRFMKVIEGARSTEALVNISSIRQAMERCYIMMSKADYSGCGSFAKLGMDDPGQSPNAHFSYVLVTGTMTMIFSRGFQIWAVRNTRESSGNFIPPCFGFGCIVACPADGSYCPSSSTAYIRLQQINNQITISGNGAFSGVQ
jgi:prepilin-type N-terminal cleavage/methylation domain-containing protein